MLFGYQAVYDRDFTDAVDYAAESGFNYVSFDLNVPRFYIDALAEDELARIRAYAKKLGVGLAFHAHDVIKGFRSHQIIGDGAIDFSKYLQVFKQTNAAVTVEVRPREAAKISRDRLAAML